MVKTNRFIVICTNTALSLIKLIKASTITVVTTNAQHISQFDGYLLEVTLLESKFSPKSSDEPRMSIMILLRDLPSFYETLNRPIADAAVTIDVKVAPLLNKPIPIYKDTLHPFISQEIQRSLLAPFSAYIRVVPDVRVHGHVSHQLAITTVKDMRKDEWTYLRAVDDGEVTVMEESLRVMIEETVFTAEECRRTGYWHEGCRWTPSALLFATFLQWRTLLVMFIDGNIDATRALRLFDTAIVFSPDENDMEKGRAAIVKWRDSGKNYDANSAAPHAMEI
ncbi:hypothetical protein GT037_003313 [Alternaria burnsii]|uniref:Uncharacterized protein n=1 Tax=Alternaria burnsii TaxID=1187904 RepID=A0A8H7BDZ6_9PLEO|nr:uncharacterized protein GT037_003313 [Alternaria burnsii]KAF7679565.1 hypothetical protein GT037_003313 [Alternaria burnsii]